MNKKLSEFYELIEDIDTCMFTTVGARGRLVSRPMANQVPAAGADLWFVTSKDAPKLAEIRRNPRVNLAYYNPKTREWVSVSGRAKMSTDRAKIRELYRPDWRAWFGDEGGKLDGTPDDPRMVLIGVNIESAIFMHANKPRPVAAFEFVKALVTRKPPSLGKTARVSKPVARRKRATSQ